MVETRDILEDLVFAEFASEKWQIKVLFQELENQVGKKYMTDPIADMLIRIKNASMVNHQFVEIPYSNLKHRLANVLLEEELVKGVEKKQSKENKMLKLTLKYKDKEPAFKAMFRVSKPGRRVYMPSKELKSRRGILVVSTPKGLMTSRDAKRKNVGGEVMVEIY